jgi:hypothetical protein
MDIEEPPFVPHICTTHHRSYDVETRGAASLPFDMSNLTSALEFAPPPLLNSTPQGGSNKVLRRLMQTDLKGGNFVQTQRIPRYTQEEEDDEEVVPDGPMSPQNIARMRSQNKWGSDLARGLDFHDQAGNDNEDQQNAL